MQNRQLESRLRKLARKRGYTLRKSRAVETHADDMGGYMITDAARNCVVFGGRFDASLEDVEAFLH